MNIDLSYQLEDPPQGLPSEEDLRCFIDLILIDPLFSSLSQDSILSIAFIEKSSIQSLNKQYRDKDYPTDVLSFVSNDHTPQGFLWGEILISPDMAQINASESKHSLSQEIKVLLVHGMLHLLGYDHENEEEAQIMQNIETLLLNSYYRGDR
jgi:probable rRNA maturation factor